MVRHKSFFASVLGGLGGLILLFSYVAFGPIGILPTSFMLIVLCVLVVYWFGAISVQAPIFLSVYVPGLAFLWARVNGAEYINYHNHWLQSIPYFVNSSVHLALVSGLLSFAVLALPTLYEKRRRSINNKGVGIPLSLYASCTLAAGFFFWLTEPSFATIITHSYRYILDDRIANTQYAGAVAMIFWLAAVVNYVRLTGGRHPCRGAERLANRFFIFVTMLGIIWLALHARRSELIGMALVILLILRERTGLRRAFIIGLGIFAALIVIEKIRGAGLMSIFSGPEQAGRADIESMPGGASNVFMSFVNALHYFDVNSYFYGETFSNYASQILPTPVYNLLGKKTPGYFSDLVFASNYSWNGGTHVLAVFFGNFGLFGVALSGVFIGLYARMARSLAISSDFVMKILGFFLLAFSFRGFWYELITIIKPVVIVLVPGLFIFSALRSIQRSHRAA